MSNNLYWYSGLYGGRSTGLPPQTLSAKDKNTKYLEATVDRLESIGKKQISENFRFRDFYRMIEGKLSYTELERAAPQLREVRDILEENFEIEQDIEHYDIIGILVNALVGEYTAHDEKFLVTNIDSISTNEYLRERNDLANKYIKEKIQFEVQRKLLEKGVDLAKSRKDFASEQEFNEYLKQIELERKALTPDRIGKFLNSEWQSKGVSWGQAVLSRDKERYSLTELYKELLIDYFGTGRAFLHFLISEDYYKPERWSPLNTFFSQEINNKYPQDGEYIGRIHRYTRPEIFKRWGSKISKSDKEKINNSSDKSNLKQFKFGNSVVSDSKKDDIFITPHKDYFIYNHMLGIQEELGIPVAEKTTLNDNNEEVTYPVFLPQHGAQNYNNYGIGEIITDNFQLRKDLIQVTEVYFTSYEEIGYLRFRTQSGLLVSEIVTKDIDKQFLKENNIRSISALSLTEALHKYRGENIIIWDYIPKTYKCVKISPIGTQLDKPLYIDLGENEFQIKGDSNIFDVRHPVASLSTKCIIDKMIPFQRDHNIVMNQIKSLLQKELGLFWLFDVKMLPSDLKEWGDTEETLLNIREVVKDTGLFPLDLSRQNLEGGGQFNQFAPQNMTVSAQIADRLSLAEKYKWMAYEQIGITPQRLGTPVKYETAEGIRVGNQAFFNQTEDLFDTFTEFKKRALNMHLAVAQYAHSNQKDFKWLYTGDDGEKAFIEISDDKLPLRMLDVVATSSSKSRRNLEIFKQQIYNNNTLGTDLVSLSEFAISDTTQEALSIARDSYNRKMEELRETREHEEKIAKIQSSRDIEKLEKSIQANEKSKIEDRKTKILVAGINAQGRAADKKTDKQGADNITDATKTALDATYKQSLVDLKNQANEIKMLDVKNKENIESKKLALQERQLDLKEKEIETKKYTSEINKN